MTSTRIVLIEDDEFVCKSIELMLKFEEEFSLIASYTSAELALASFDTMQELPDIAIVDIHLPRMSGLDFLAYVQGLYPTIKCLVHTVDESDETVFQAIQRGACGYIVKNAPPLAMTDALRIIAMGGSVMSFHIANKVMHFLQAEILQGEDKNTASSTYDDIVHILPPRTREVLDLIAQGKSYQAIARELRISINTVRYHIKEIYHHLEVTSRHEALQKIYAMPRAS